MSNTCIVPNCDYYAAINENCLYHAQLQGATINPIYCVIPHCVNKSKTKNSLLYCLKHTKKVDTCCFRYCRYECKKDESFCERHLRFNGTCKKIQCNEEANPKEFNGYCVKHSLDKKIGRAHV